MYNVSTYSPLEKGVWENPISNETYGISRNEEGLCFSYSGMWGLWGKVPEEEQDTCRRILNAQAVDETIQYLIEEHLPQIREELESVAEEESVATKTTMKALRLEDCRIQDRGVMLQKASNIFDRINAILAPHNRGVEVYHVIDGGEREIRGSQEGKYYVVSTNSAPIKNGKVWRDPKTRVIYAYNRLNASAEHPAPKKVQDRYDNACRTQKSACIYQEKMEELNRQMNILNVGLDNLEREAGQLTDSDAILDYIEQIAMRAFNLLNHIEKVYNQAEGCLANFEPE